MATLIEKIDEWLSRTGQTQAALERSAGLPDNRISKWRETGEPTLRQGLRMARVMGVDVSYLADDEQDEPPIPPAELSADESAALGLYRKLLGRLASPANALALLADLYAAVGVVPPGHRVSGVSLGLERMPEPAGGAGPERTPMTHVRKRTLPEKL